MTKPVQSFTFSTNDFTIGAIYAFGAARNLDRAALVYLLTTRARMAEQKAAQLAGHWLTTEPYRVARTVAKAA